MFFTGKFVLDLAYFAQTINVDPNTIIQSSGFTKEELETQYVDYNSVSEVFKTIKKEINDPSFGLHIGEQITLQSTDYVNQLMDKCSTVKEAFEFAIAYSKLISDSMDCSLEMHDDHFKVNFELNPNWSLQDDYAIAQNLDLALLCAKNSLYRLTQKEYTPTEVNFFYPRPKKVNEHYRLLNTHLNFNQPISSIVFGKHILNQSTIESDQGLLSILKVGANQIIDILPSEEELIFNVKRSILKNLMKQLPDIELVAKDLGMSIRMLQRQLKAQGTYFKSMQNELRFQLVKKMYSNGLQNIDELAFLTGYSDSSALIRAFKKWTGKSPKSYFSEL